MKLLACVNSYVQYRQSLGVGFCGEKGALHAFVRSVGDIELRTLTPKAVRHYLDGDGPITNYWLSKYHTLTGFYRYAISRKYVSVSPLPLDKPPPAKVIRPLHLFGCGDGVALAGSGPEIPQLLAVKPSHYKNASAFAIRQRASHQ